MVLLQWLKYHEDLEAQKKEKERLKEERKNMRAKKALEKDKNEKQTAQPLKKKQKMQEEEYSDSANSDIGLLLELDSESDSDLELMRLDEELPGDVKDGSWVLLKYSESTAKKQARFFVAKVVSVEDGNITVQYLKKSGRNTFKWPTKLYIHTVSEDMIERVLPEPEKISQNSGVLGFTFSVDFSDFNVE